MSETFNKIPMPKNEPVMPYAKGSNERKLIEAELKKQLSNQIEIPIIINGEEIKTGIKEEIRCPHDHSKVLGFYHKAGAKEAALAIASALEARKTCRQLRGKKEPKFF